MVGYFAKEDGFKMWEMPNTYCRRDAVMDANQSWLATS